MPAPGDALLPSSDNNSSHSQARLTRRETHERPPRRVEQRKESQLKSHTLRGLGYVAVALASVGACAPLLAQQAPSNANAGRALESAPPPPQELKKDANVLPPTDAPRAPAGPRPRAEHPPRCWSRASRSPATRSSRPTNCWRWCSPGSARRPAP